MPLGNYSLGLQEDLPWPHWSSWKWLATFVSISRDHLWDELIVRRLLYSYPILAIKNTLLGICRALFLLFSGLLCVWYQFGDKVLRLGTLLLELCAHGFLSEVFTAAAAASLNFSSKWWTVGVFPALLHLYPVYEREWPFVDLKVHRLYDISISVLHLFLPPLCEWDMQTHLGCAGSHPVQLLSQLGWALIAFLSFPAHRLCPWCFLPSQTLSSFFFLTCSIWGFFFNWSFDFVLGHP